MPLSPGQQVGRPPIHFDDVGGAIPSSDSTIDFERPVQFEVPAATLRRSFEDGSGSAGGRSDDVGDVGRVQFRETS